MNSRQETFDLRKLNRSCRVGAARSLTDNSPLKNIPKDQKSRSSISLNGKHNPKNKTDFKFVSESELEAAVKRVRRAKQKKQDDEEWQEFLKLHQQKFLDVSRNNVCKSCSAREIINCSECGLPAPPTKNPHLTLNGEALIRQKENECTKEPVSVCDEKGGALILDQHLSLTSHVYQLGPGLKRRLQDLLTTVKRMTELLLNPNLHTQFEDEDVDRLIKRSLEFDAMFARNHLYEMQRLLKATKQLAVTKNKNTYELEVKISAALKSVIQALQVYTRHIGKGSRVKYQQVVPIFQSITCVLELLEQLSGQRLFPMRKEIEVSCSYMKKILLEISTTETKTISVMSQKVVLVHSKRKPSADLSMYNRKKNDWHRKSAALARARFGAPSASRCFNKYGSLKKGAVENINKKNKLESSSFGHTVDSQRAHKETVNGDAKEVPFRNATRAVPEEQITTMMEIIPHEKSVQLSKMNYAEGSKRPVSSRRNSKDSRNIGLVFLTESATKPLLDNEVKGETVFGAEDKLTELTIDDLSKCEALDFQQKMMEYHKSSAHYKDNKAVGIVKRLTNNLLSEMIMDFQKDEMDQVIHTLFNLEFD